MTQGSRSCASVVDEEIDLWPKFTVNRQQIGEVDERRALISAETSRESGKTSIHINTYDMGIQYQ